MTAAPVPGALPEEIRAYYDGGAEVGRLAKGIGLLEQARTQELLTRCLPPPPAVILDVGGGPGVYACWLARAGYQVYLSDPMPLHVEEARRASRAQPAHPIASLRVGDARQLTHPDASADAVLLLGPLYHLTERQDRLAALREAARVLRPGGALAAVGITRYASTLVGLTRWWIEDPAYREMMRRELAEGLHVQPPDWPRLFTTAYFHRPDELGDELAEAGLEHLETLAVEGPGWIAPQFEERWAEAGARQALLQVVRWLEREPVALGMSPHVMAIARKGRSEAATPPREGGQSSRRNP